MTGGGFSPWLRHRLPVMLMALTLGLLGALVLSLHAQPLAPYLYACSLAAVTLLIWLVFDWLRFLHQRQALSRLMAGLPDSLTHLPAARSPLDKDYQALLQQLGQMHRQQRTADDARYQALLSYQALWNHQVKTPIAAMRLLLAREDTEHSRQLLSELFKIEQYVEMALHYVRLDEQASDFVFARQALYPIAQSAARKYAGQFVLKRLSLQIDIPDDVLIVTDAKWLGFVIEQLLSNAVKYSHQGGVQLRYEAAGHELIIQDSGIGISPQDLPRVFDLGYTGYSGRVFQQSTGIGLYLCQQTCAKLGIRLSLDSVPGQGTTARLRLPPDDLQVE